MEQDGKVGTISSISLLVMHLLTRVLGMLHLKHLQEISLPPGSIYIRRAIEIPNFENINMTELDGLDDIEDLDLENEVNIPFRMVVCMLKEASFQLQSAQYLQSDIGFKRVIGFKEFELGGLDSESRTSKALLISYHSHTDLFHIEV